jgi:Homeodomain
LFASRPQPKKKRKSRTAFTNHQIFELEKRFLYQKYLSPADRDEIAAALGLSNAQVSGPRENVAERIIIIKLISVYTFFGVTNQID